VESASFEVYLYWQANVAGDAGDRWLRELVRDPLKVS
jgi:hypothetical protein